eukprot:EG_transcript_15843
MSHMSRVPHTGGWRLLLAAVALCSAGLALVVLSCWDPHTTLRATLRPANPLARSPTLSPHWIARVSQRSRRTVVNGGFLLGETIREANETPRREAGSPVGLLAAVAAASAIAASVAKLAGWWDPAEPAPPAPPKLRQRAPSRFSRRALVSSVAAGTLLAQTAAPALAEEAAWTRLDPVLAEKQYQEAKLEEENRRIQAINRVPGGFPVFVRDGYNVKIKVPDTYKALPSGLVVYDFPNSNLEGPTPQDGQKVVFHYTAYNENGARIDTSYNGNPLEQVVGINGMVPGFEEGIKGMHIGGQRRIIVPPELGPPVGPSTFFSAKQYEVFDVELIDILDCRREGFSIMSRLVCTKGPV